MTISGATTFNLIGGGIICLLISALGFFLYNISTKSDQQKLSWLTTSAIIQSSKLKLETEMKGGTSTTSRSVSHVWRVKVSYTYEVEGKQYTGDTITNNNPPGKLVFDSKTPQPDSLVKIRDQYIPGSKIQIHYNPKNTSESFIYFTPSTREKHFALGMIILFLILGGFLLIAGFRKIS